MTKNTETTICKNCGSFFKRRTKNANARSKEGIRGKNTVTCSKECSKQWMRNKKGEKMKKEREYKRRLEKLKKERVI